MNLWPQTGINESEWCILILNLFGLLGLARVNKLNQDFWGLKDMILPMQNRVVWFLKQGIIFSS